MVVSESVRQHAHVIGGRDVQPEDGYISRVNPATGEVVAMYANGTVEETLSAIAAARNEFDSGTWPQLSGTQRSRILQRWSDLIEAHAETLVRIEIEEGGKPARVARGDIEGVVALTSYAAALAQNLTGESHTDFGSDLQAMVVHEPVGVVGAIVPWNFPSIIFAQKVPFALAAGCTVVVKPSEMTSGTAIEMTRLGHEAGIPASALNVVTGYGVPVGDTLVRSEDVDMISFTGSTRTGLQVLKGQEVNFKRVSLELGGKSAAIVFADANIDAAIDGVLFSIYMNQGQVCCAGSRLLVEDSIGDEFLARLADRVNQLSVGDPADASVDLGPLISEQHRDLVAGFVDRAVQDGASLGTTNALPEVPQGTAFYPPVVLNGVTPDMPVFRDEVFGPVLTTTRFTSVDEAVELANMSQYGLAGSVWTTNIDTALTVARRVRTGTIEINTSLEGQPQLPFGGYKISGIGREKGAEGLREFTETKTIGIRTTPRTPFF
ncbi:aldehyde dehydrogenase family protein [Rhodococcus sp. NPDC057529]|uniref:aldehyde dehydrogenase family protein n=1 Tax=Rhodococcus sp. NPDC057529 TaxID=3346158 RepID=UPI00366C5E72